MELNPELFQSYHSDMSADGLYNATHDSHGLYSTFQFVLRLSPLVHKLLADSESGIRTSGEIGFEATQAMSIFLHETVHWWQHIGSTHGFVLGLNYPIQTHSTHSDLKSMMAEIGFKKPITSLAETLDAPDGKGFGTVDGKIQTIINNHFDLQVFREFSYDTEHAKSITKHPLFESVGHAFHMTHAHTLNILASTVDREFDTLPHPKDWHASFKSLKDKKVKGFYYGSPVDLWPIGAREIFEGQACFCQLQYLAFASGNKLKFEDFEALGILHGVYRRAFDTFLECAELDLPEKVDHPTVALFLLVCDMAINPGAGFPFSPEPHYKTFIGDTNPGERFCFISKMIGLRFKSMGTAITEYSRTEYETITSELAEALVLHAPLQIAETFSGWFKATGPLHSLRNEYETFDFGLINLPVRVLFAHFLAFMEDKYKTPEFFCWPGAWMAGEKVSSQASELFYRHGSLFIDGVDSKTIVPRILPGRDQDKVQEVFNTFYGGVVVYDLTRQWITESGPFHFEYSWLHDEAGTNEMSDFARKQFIDTYGRDPVDVDQI